MNKNQCSIPDKKKATAYLGKSLAVASARCRVSDGGPSMGQASISCPVQVVNSGVDTLHIAYDLAISKGLLERLSEEKAGLQETDSETECVFQLGSSELFSFNLQRTGVKLYPYVLKTGDVTLMLSNRKQGASIPNAFLRIGSLTCQAGVPDFIKTFKMWLRHHKITIWDEKVSRVDLAADFAAPLAALNVADQDYQITRATKFATYHNHRKLTGIQVGSGDIVLRIYDKLAELDDKRADHKKEFFSSIWGDCPSVTRVEFQLRREAIKQFDIGGDTVTHVLSSVSKIWQYLTVSWFRHCSARVDRENKNQSRADESSFWLSVQSVFFSVVGCSRSRRQRHINFPALMKQATGCLVTALAAIGSRYDEQEKIISAGVEAVKFYLLDYLNGGNKQDFASRTVSAVITF